MTVGQDRVRELTKNMLRKKLFVVLSSGKKGRDLAPALAAHLQYMIDLERQGVLFASGPFDGGTAGDGLTILRTESLEQTREIAERDPFVIKGLRTFQVREWMLMEGSLGLKVNFSDRSIEVA
jgi:uncharacterized protein